MPIFGVPQYVPPYPMWRYETTTTTTATPAVPITPTVPTKDRLRQIVREELADLIPVDVPDFPPEG